MTEIITMRKENKALMGYEFLYCGDFFVYDNEVYLKISNSMAFSLEDKKEINDVDFDYVEKITMTHIEFSFQQQKESIKMDNIELYSFFIYCGDVHFLWRENYSSGYYTTINIFKKCDIILGRDDIATPINKVTFYID